MKKEIKSGNGNEPKWYGKWLGFFTEARRKCGEKNGVKTTRFT